MRFLALLNFLLILNLATAQDFPYRIAMDSISIPELGGLQSYSIGQHNGKWLIVGGRLDGLHRRQPWATFDIAGHNNELWVVDPVNKKKWTAPLTSLDSALKEQLSSTNMQFIQRDSVLFLFGGYGFSRIKDDHITLPNLTTINVPGAIDAIINGGDLKKNFNQVVDERFAICGGQLLFLNKDFYLIGGHRFDGRYNPMDNPTFVQSYSNSVHKFRIELKGLVPYVDHLPSYTDESLMHRRDFNVLPAITAWGEQVLIAFSGVFQKDVNIPYLNAVVVARNGMMAIPDFAQYYNHYHCANVSLLDPESKKNHFLFFGGIAQYYDSSGILVQDNDVPFTQTIGHVVLNENYVMEEYKHPLQMPGYLGAASEFIPVQGIKQFENEVVDMSSFKGDSILLGYIFGGISSSANNIFWINEGTESKASSMIYPIYLIKAEGGYGALLNPQSSNGLQLQVYPDPVEGEISIAFIMPADGAVEIVLKNLKGDISLVRSYKKVSRGEFVKTIKFRKLDREISYFLQLTVNGKTLTQKMIVH